MYTRNCPQCGKELSYSAKCSFNRAIKRNSVCVSCVKKGKKPPNYGKTHSEETLRKMSEAKKGEKHPLYGKFHSEEHRRNMSIGSGGNGELNRKWPRHVAWAKRVKERDGCCQKCSSTEDLHAHHLIPKALMPQNAYVVANGITLCKDCHIELHKILCQN